MLNKTKTKFLLCLSVFFSCLYIFDLYFDDFPVGEKTAIYKKKFVKKTKKKKTKII